MWRSVFLSLSRSRAMRQLSTRAGIARNVALRFVAGETAADAMAVAAQLNGRGAGAEIDYLGENVTTPEQAESAAATYLELLDLIADEGVDAQVSLKLTQMGLDLDPEVCLRNVERVVKRAGQGRNFVWLDMESSEYTDRTLRLYRRLRSSHENVGVAIQAYLYRSKADVLDLLSIGGTVRLCKGAYLEPPRVAFPRKTDVDRNFALLAELLVSGHGPQAIATHDEKMVRHVVQFARAKGIDRRTFEFQMLYGVRRDLQERLLRDGYRLRVYVPFGGEWYPYLMRRLAERPANLLFLLSNLVRETRSRA